MNRTLSPDCRVPESFHARAHVPNPNQEAEQSGKKKYAHVGDPPKLLKQIPREKSDDGVLGGDDLVRGVLVLLEHPVFLVVIVVRQGFVNEDGARGPRSALAGEEVLDAPVGQLVVPAHEVGAFCGGRHRLCGLRLSLVAVSGDEEADDEDGDEGVWEGGGRV